VTQRRFAACLYGSKTDLAGMSASGAKRRSLLATDKNVARAYRFAIKAGIGRCLRFCETDSPPRVCFFIWQGASLFGNNYQAIENARDILGIFFKCPLKWLNNQADFDSTIRKFDPSRPGQAFRRTWPLQQFHTGTMHCWKNGAIQMSSTRRRTECITTQAPMTPFLSRCRS
jgi:hypothetical protein